MMVSGDWQFHHDNAPAHSSGHMQAFFFLGGGAKHRIKQVCHLPTAQTWLPATSGFSQS